jgi:hypothetical protein
MLRNVMTGGRASRFVALAAIAAPLLLLAGAPSGAEKDPLAADVARWAKYVQENPSKDDFWMQIKESVSPSIARTQQALTEGRRLLALQRLASWRPNLDGETYVEKFSEAQRSDDKAFEAEWARAGKEIPKETSPASSASVANLRPAAVRAVGEAALPQVRGLYEASLEYGRNTMANFGFFYIGAAIGQRDFLKFLGTLHEPASKPAPALRSIAPELDALEAELLSAYRPPASIDRHPEFIGASSTLNEARELDAAELRYGALLRYLQAALRVAPLRGKTADAPAAEALGKKLQELDARLSASPTDETIGRIFLQSAQSEVAAASGGNLAVAGTIADDVLPRYFAALAPARPAPARPPAQVTVTLVRWPYT